MMGIIEVLFAAELAGHMDSLPFVLALYKTVEEVLQKMFKKNGIEGYCINGCSACCMQQVSCSQLEFQEIVDYITRMPQEVKIKLLQRLWLYSEDWNRYARGKEYIFNVVTNQGKKDNDRAYKAWFGKACPFLAEDGSCSIYPVRILECWLTFSSVRCQVRYITSGQPGNAVSDKENQSFLFEYQCLKTLATQALMGRQARTTGAPIIMPIHAWLVGKEFQAFLAKNLQTGEKGRNRKKRRR